MKQFIDAGAIYGHGRDEKKRPIIVYNVRKALDMGLGMDEFLDVLDYVFRYIIAHGLVPGRVETVNFICDVNDVPVYDFPIMDLASMAKRTKKSFKLRVAQIIVTNCHWLLKAGAMIIKNFVDPRMMGKLSFHSDNGAEHMAAFI